MARLSALIESGAASAPEAITRQFSLACPDHHEVSYVPRLLPLFRQRLPRARLRIVSKDFQLGGGGLATGEIDAALAPRGSAMEPLHSEVLFQEHVVLVARRGHPKLRGRLTRECFNALEHIEVLIPLGQPGSRKVNIQEAMAREGLVRKTVLAVPHFTTAACVVARSELVALLPRTLAEELAPALCLTVHDVPFSLPGEGFWTCLMWHARTHADPASRHFRQVIIDALRMG